MWVIIYLVVISGKTIPDLLHSRSPATIVITEMKLKKRDYEYRFNDIFEGSTLFYSGSAPIDPLKGTARLDCIIAE